MSQIEEALRPAVQNIFAKAHVSEPYEWALSQVWAHDRRNTEDWTGHRDTPVASLKGTLKEITPDILEGVTNCIGEGLSRDATCDRLNITRGIANRAAQILNLKFPDRSGKACAEERYREAESQIRKLLAHGVSKTKISKIIGMDYRTLNRALAFLKIEVA